MPEPLVCLLDQSAKYLSALWPERRGHALQLEELRQRLVEQRLQIAVLGQFKRGKSTFLNALLGQPILPTGVLPLTAVPTFIRWAPSPSLKVTYLDGRSEILASTDVPPMAEDLFRLVTEEGNPHNQAKVARVDLELTAPILRDGITLIDTPGIGSTLQHNTDTALRVLPQCDAGFLVISTDPPVTAAELDYLDQIRPHVTRLFFILNKIDYLDERDRIAAGEFLRRALRDHMPAGADIQIFNLSARRALEAKQAHDEIGVAASGLAEIERHLSGFLVRDKNAALQSAVVAKARSVLDAAGMDIAIERRALAMPIEDLEARAAEFATALNEIEQQRLVARDLLAGDRRRAAESLEALAAQLRHDARSILKRELDRALNACRETGDPEDAAKRAIASAIPEFFGPKLDQISRSFAADTEAMLTRHVQEADRIISAVRKTAAALFEIPSVPAGEADTFVVAREPFWVTQKWDETIASLAGGALDRLVPRSVRVARIGRRIARQIDDLVQRNVENLRWATSQNVDVAFRRFAAWFDDRLTQTIEAIQGAIETARQKRGEHVGNAEARMAELCRAAETVAATVQELSPASGAA